MIENERAERAILSHAEAYRLVEEVNLLRARAETVEADLAAARQQIASLATGERATLDQLIAVTKERDEARQRAQALTEWIKDALDCLPRALDGSSPFSMSQRAEVMLAIETLRKALAASPPAPPARPRELETECLDGWEHDWVGLTRHADPPGMGGVLPNAICERCSDQRYIPIPRAAPADVEGAS